ncbi:MAG TPA: hypothetical protein VET65_11915 [Candidatus Limnocylindrales bacterium]|nr:hypothetical protein [Candidatus Limnocylindrales bacterium]
MSSRVSRTQADDVGPARLTWIAGYRSMNPDADRWARGTHAIRHTPLTQERVFRMVEQLAHRGLDRSSVFLALQLADRQATRSDDCDRAAEAGYEAIASLARVDRGAIVITGDEDVDSLLTFGFEPIPFDGEDPAAFAWLIYELTCRRHAALTEANPPCECHERSDRTPIGVAVGRSSPA